MTKKGWMIATACLLLQLATTAQNKDSLSTKLDSLHKQADTIKQQNTVDPGFYNERTTMNGRVFGLLLLNDIKQQALSPLDIKRRGWITGATLLAGTVGLSFLDKPIQRNAVRYRNNNPGIQNVSRVISNVGGTYEVATFAGVAVAGYVFKSPKLRTTTALATQAYVTSVVWSTIFKNLSGRLRPQTLDPGDPANSPRFHGPFFTSNSSFPSQHATLAFAAARVYAMEYKNIPAIPIIAYSAASLITLSRLTENKHWATDLVAGSLLGWACGTQVVNNYHRYARLIRTGEIHKKQKKGSISMNLQYINGGGLQPELVYHFPS
jgi:membrane-associated phospholipid phosphatase